MKKLVASLIIVYIVIALYSLTFNVNISIYSLLDNLGRASWYEFPIDELRDIVDDFENVSFPSISWKDVVLTWKLWQKMAKLVTYGFSIFTGILEFSQDSIKFIIMNMFEFLKVMFNFLKPNIA